MPTREPDLWWDEVKCFFDPERMGALPDVFVHDATVDDWQAVFDLVQAQGWAWLYKVDPVELVGVPLPSAAEALAYPRDEGLVTLDVWPRPDVLLIFRPWSADTIDFDIDLRELQGQDNLDLLCDLFRTIGRTLGKAVEMTAEGNDGFPVLGFDPAVDRVVLLADPAY